MVFSREMLEKIHFFFWWPSMLGIHPSTLVLRNCSWSWILESSSGNPLGSFLKLDDDFAYWVLPRKLELKDYDTALGNAPRTAEGFEKRWGGFREVYVFRETCHKNNLTSYLYFYFLKMSLQDVRNKVRRPKTREEPLQGPPKTPETRSTISLNKNQLLFSLAHQTQKYDKITKKKRDPVPFGAFSAAELPLVCHRHRRLRISSMPRRPYRWSRWSRPPTGQRPWDVRKSEKWITRPSRGEMRWVVGMVLLLLFFQVVGFDSLFS